MKKGLFNFLQFQAQPERSAAPLSENVNVLSELKKFVHFAEFKRILDKVATSQSEQKIKSLAILSKLPGEGKTLFTAALAAGLSELLHTKILVVDTQTYHSPNALTLDRALEADEISREKSAIQKTLVVETDLFPVEGFSGGRAGISEFRIGEVIKKYSEHYGLILFDTSALSKINRNNIDPWVVARHVDASILVVGRETVRTNLSPQFFERKDANKIKIAGVVFNEGIPNE